MVSFTKRNQPVLRVAKVHARLVSVVNVDKTKGKNRFAPALVLE